MASDSIDLSVIMPAHNEGPHLEHTIRETLKTLNETGLKYEIIISDDGSKDETLNKAKKLSKKHDTVSYVTIDKNQGKGHAIKKAFPKARGKMIFFMDADMDLHPRQLHEFLRLLKDNGSDIVIGSKRHAESEVNYPFKRRFLSFMYQMFIFTFFGLNVRDTQVGMKLFKREVLEKVLPKVIVKKYAFDLELLAVAHHFGYQTIEAPIHLNYKFFGSGVDAESIKKIFVDTCAVFYRLYIIKYYDN